MPLEEQLGILALMDQEYKAGGVLVKVSQVKGMVLVVATFLLVGVVAMNWRAHSSRSRYTSVEIVLADYLQAKNMKIDKHTPEYQMFLRGILLGEHPGLTDGPDSQDIQKYALEYLRLEPDR